MNWKEILHYLHIWHKTHEAMHDGDKKQSKWGAIFLIVIGFFLAPLLIGVPMMIYGFIKLFD